MAPRPPFEHDLATTQMHDTGVAMRNYLKSLDRSATPEKGASRPATPNMSLLSSFQQDGRNHQNPTSPILGTSKLPGSPSLSQTRPRSANRDMHLHAATALAFDGTMGSTNPARGGTAGWGQPPLPTHPRPTTMNKIFARPDTAYSMVDTKGKEEAQLSLAEKTKAFNEASSHYLVLDSVCEMVLFHSTTLPGTIRTGSSFPDLVGPQHAAKIKAKVAKSERVDIQGASLAVPSMHDPRGLWKAGVKLSVTPLKDQIDEVGAVIVLISNNSLVQSN
jgi:hypothetical protein